MTLLGTYIRSLDRDLWITLDLKIKLYISPAEEFLKSDKMKVLSVLLVSIAVVHLSNGQVPFLGSCPNIQPAAITLPRVSFNQVTVHLYTSNYTRGSEN